MPAATNLTATLQVKAASFATSVASAAAVVIREVIKAIPDSTPFADGTVITAVKPMAFSTVVGGYLAAHDAVMQPRVARPWARNAHCFTTSRVVTCDVLLQTWLLE